jgi:hypothetical protein
MQHHTFDATRDQSGFASRCASFNSRKVAALFVMGKTEDGSRWEENSCWGPNPDIHSAANQYTDSAIPMHYLHLRWDNNGIRRQSKRIESTAPNRPNETYEDLKINGWG